jgi:hypothetical protein
MFIVSPMGHLHFGHVLFLPSFLVVKSIMDLRRNCQTLEPFSQRWDLLPKAKIAYIQNDLHHPFVPSTGLIRDAELTERNVLMDNRSKIPRSVRGRYRFSMTPQAFGQGHVFEREAFCLSRAILGTDKKVVSP